MTRRIAPAVVALLLTGALWSAPASSGQEGTGQKDTPSTVYKDVSAEKLEKILQSLGIEFKKDKGKRAGVVYYDFRKGDRPVRLHNYNGKDLWLDTIYDDKLTLALVNGWNVRAKFSRAVQLKNGEKTTVSLESQIDCTGGVTDAILRQFVRRFDNEIRQFEKYISK